METISPAPRYLTPVIGSAEGSKHLAAALQLAGRTGGQVVALLIGLVPSALPIGADVPERWSRLEFEAARARRIGQQWGQEVETTLALSDSAGLAVALLAAECQADAICLAYEPGLLAALHRWRDPLWRTVLAEAPCAVVVEALQERRSQPSAHREALGARVRARRSAPPVA
jgi:hypothetical protein